MRSAGKIAAISIVLAGQALVAAAFAQSPDDMRILCRNETDTGTRLPPHRVCRTRAEWRMLEKQLHSLDASGEVMARYVQGLKRDPVQ